MLLAFGMFISVPIIIFGSTIVIKVMNRFSWLIYVGGAILGWAAGGMLASDPYLPFGTDNAGLIKIILTVVTLAGGYILKHWSSFKKS
jgi:predicted tellurium resistance membrane protein TerC